MGLRHSCRSLSLENSMAEDNKENVTPAVESVTIPKDTLQKILDQLDKQDKTLAANKEQMDILRESVNTGKLADAENKRKPDEMPTAFLKVFMGKVVVGWKNEKTEMLYHPSNPDAAVGEVLKASYTFIDGTKSPIVDQVLFTRCDDRIIVRLLDGKNALRNEGLVDLNVRAESLISGDEDLRKSFELPKEDFKINRNFINP